MSIEKELGGGRIGNGKQVEVHMHGYERSNHDLTKVLRTTQSIGTVLPVYTEMLLPGDTVEMDLAMKLITRPTEGQLLGSMKVEMHVFKWDLRLGVAKMHMNQQGVGLDVGQIKFPLVRMEADAINWNKEVNNQQINPSSIWKYFGVSGLGTPTNPLMENVTREFTAFKLLAYWEIIKEFYANKQEGIGAVIHGKNVIETVGIIYVINGGTAVELPKEGEGTAAINIRRSTTIEIYYTAEAPELEEIEINYTREGIAGNATAGEMFNSVEYIQDGSVTYIRLGNTKREYANVTANSWDYVQATDARPPKIETFPLTNIDEMRMDILADIKNPNAFIIDNTSIAPYGLSLQKYGTIWSKRTNQEGLAVKTYPSDKFQNWLDTTWVNNISAKSAVNTASGSFTIDALIFQRKTWTYLNRVLAAGGTLDDWQEVTYDVKRWSKPEVPVYEGGKSQELTFLGLDTTAATEGQPAGTPVGKGILRDESHGGRVNIKADEPALIMVLASITPRIGYSQGNKWDMNLKSLEDLHKPEFDQIGFQDLITDQMAYWESRQNNVGNWIFQSAGKQTAWLNWQTNVDENAGNFAEGGNETWMVLDRRYQVDRENRNIKDLTTYIDPVLFNYIWADSSRDAQNIWAQYAVRAKFRRKMSASKMPNL